MIALKLVQKVITCWDMMWICGCSSYGQMVLILCTLSQFFLYASPSNRFMPRRKSQSCGKSKLLLRKGLLSWIWPQINTIWLASCADTSCIWSTVPIPHAFDPLCTDKSDCLYSLLGRRCLCTAGRQTCIWIENIQMNWANRKVWLWLGHKLSILWFVIRGISLLASLGNMPNSLQGTNNDAEGSK